MVVKKILISMDHNLDEEIRTHIKVTEETFSGFLRKSAKKELKKKEVERYGINKTTA